MHRLEVQVLVITKASDHNVLHSPCQIPLHSQEGGGGGGGGGGGPCQTYEAA